MIVSRRIYRKLRFMGPRSMMQEIIEEDLMHEAKLMLTVNAKYGL
jgi:hypothetical protein